MAKTGMVQNRVAKYVTVLDCHAIDRFCNSRPSKDLIDCIAPLTRTQHCYREPAGF